MNRRIPLRRTCCRKLAGLNLLRWQGRARVDASGKRDHRERNLPESICDLDAICLRMRTQLIVDARKSGIHSTARGEEERRPRVTQHSS